VPPPPGGPYVTPPPAGASNGMAIAALVLGILSFFCVGPIVGVPAVVLGLIGLSKAKETGTGRGMSIAGIVLGAVGSVVIVLGFVLLVVVADDASNRLDEIAQNIGGEADPDDYELQTDSCEVSRSGGVTFEGTIENTAGRDMNFEIETEIREADSDVLLETPTAYVEIPEGDTVRWRATTFLSEPTDVTCEVTGVDNYFN
jgi:hypothetical protein